MAHPLKHAQSSARKFGGRPEDYLPIHNWFDESKAFFPDFRHRALRHHAEGIFLAENLFGIAIVNSDGTKIPVRYLGEQHVREDLGRIPTAQDWLLQIRPQRWMYGQALEKEEYQPPVVSIVACLSCETIESAKTSSNGCRCSNDRSGALFTLGVSLPTDCAQQAVAMKMPKNNKRAESCLKFPSMRNTWSFGSKAGGRTTVKYEESDARRTVQRRN